jgi:hypothetical protein
VINEAALTYMRCRGLSETVIARLAEHPTRTFPDAAAWQAHLEELGITALQPAPAKALRYAHISSLRSPSSRPPGSSLRLARGQAARSGEPGPRLAGTLSPGFASCQPVPS